MALFFGLSFPDADFVAALVLLAVASVSFVGIGMVTAVLPLISPEKGAQLGFVAQGMLLVVSGVYYPVRSCRAGWSGWPSCRRRPTRWRASARRCSTAKGLERARRRPVAAGACSAWSRSRVGLAVFRAGERYAKRHGKLKRSG